MSSDARRKERKRLKREKKKADQRRAHSVSPYKRIGTAGELEACYVNSNWREQGLAAVYVIRRNPAGGHALACFLVDVWCSGLKDAWVRLDFAQEDLDHALERARSDFDLTRIDIEAARTLVAAAIRFSRLNGFRLPPHYERCVQLIGGVGDWNTADLSAFGRNGNLLWVGPIDDLRRRLIGCSVEEFLQRPDVHVVNDAEPFEARNQEDQDDEEDENDEDLTEDDRADRYYTVLDQLPRVVMPKLLAEMRERGEDPHPRLQDGIRLAIAAQLVAKDEKVPEEQLDVGARARRAAVAQVFYDWFGEDAPKELPEDLIQAVKQASEQLAHMRDEVEAAIGSDAVEDFAAQFKIV